jgi:recombining binding protein (suppressor of hairless)
VDDRGHRSDPVFEFLHRLLNISLCLDQVRYNFYVPPVLFDRQSAPQTGSLPIPSKPVTPFPGVVKYLPPDRAAEAPKMHSSSSSGGIIPGAGKHDSKLLHIYGENFSKTDPIHVYFGSEPSPFVDVTCPEALRCLPPPPESHHPPGKRRPVILVRSDGVVFPTNTMYP